MKISLSFLSLLLGLQTALAQVSAQRDRSIPYAAYEAEALATINKDEVARTALKTAKLYSGEEVFEVPEWTEAQLAEGFTKIRDERFLLSVRNEEFRRRLSWLYPHDGCFSRAAQANVLLKAAGFPVPKKVFAFGELEVNTNFSADGDVAWWYHVAPVVQVNGEVFVLDPAINAVEPVRLAVWLSLMGEKEKIKVAVCEVGTVFPKDNCDLKTLSETSGLRAQRFYLNKEWDNLVKLGHKPTALLGDAPPWSLPDLFPFNQ